MVKRKKIVILTIALMVGFVTRLWADLYKIPEDLNQEVKKNRQWVVQEPKSPTAHFELAMSYASTGRILDGWAELKRVSELDGAYAGQVIKKYEAMTKSDPENWQNFFKLAFGYYFDEKKELASASFRQVVKIDPKNIWGYGFWALVEGEIGHIDTAIDLCKKALDIEPNAAAIHYLYSEALGRRGDTLGSWGEKMITVKLMAEESLFRKGIGE